MMRYPVKCESSAVLNLWIMTLIFMCLFIIPVSATNYEHFMVGTEPTGLISLNTNHTFTTPFANQSYTQTYCGATYGGSFNSVNDRSYVQKFSAGYYYDSAYYNLSGATQYDYGTFELNSSGYTTVIVGVVCKDAAGINAHYEYREWWNRIDQEQFYRHDAPVANYKNFACSNNCTIPATISVEDDSTGLIDNYNWTFNWVGTSTSLYEESEDVSFLTELPGYIYAGHCVSNNGGYSCVHFSFTINNNATTPAINITTNITAPNFTPIIPTLPLTIAPLPSQLNRTLVRGLINGSVYANVSEDYLAYWDDFYDGLYQMATEIIDVLLFPVAMVTAYLNTPNTWILQLATQYSERSNNIIPYMFAVVYAFPPKLLNLVTYSLCLDFVLVLMREFGSKK